MTRGPERIHPKVATTKRVAVLFDAYPHLYGGSQRVNHLLAKRLPTQGWDARVVVPANGRFPDRLRADGIVVDVAPAPLCLRRYGRTTSGLNAIRAAMALPGYWMRLSRLLRRSGATVVHASDLRGIVLVGVPARMAGARVVWHVHAMGASNLLNNLVGRAVSHAVIVPSAELVEHLHGASTRRRPALVVSNVVAPEFHRPITQELVAEPNVISVGRLHPDKGVDVLIDAFAVARQQLPGAHLSIVGGTQDGYEDYASDLRAQVARLGLTSCVEFVDATDTVAKLVQASRVYVQASRTETFGMSILEAMAAGVPVIATGVGGVVDHVTHEVTGLLVPSERPDLLAAAIVRSLTDVEGSERLRRAAARVATREQYTPEALIESVASIYDRQTRSNRS